MNVLVESEKLGIEYDDDVPCDVCQSVKSTNILIFFWQLYVDSYKICIFNSPSVKKAMKWYFAIVAMFAFIR